MTFPRRELGLAFVCGGLLMLEICLTKIFSIVLWYHFGFLAVSTALLGFASSGVYLSLKKDRVVGPAAERPIAVSAAIAAVAVVLSLWLVTQTSFDVYTVRQDRTIGTLVAFVLWVTLPFFFLGMVISRTLSAFPERANVLYGADLIGSALGCFAAVFILNQNTAGQTVILLSAALIAFGGMLFAGARPLIQTACVVGLAVPVASLMLLDVDTAFPLKSPKSKPYYQVESMAKMRAELKQPELVRGTVTMKDGNQFEAETPFTLVEDGGVRVFTDDGPRVVDTNEVALAESGGGLSFEPVPWSPYRLWSSLSRVDAFHWPAVYDRWGLWGMSPTFRGTQMSLPRQKGITIDAWAMTSIMRYSGMPLWPPGTPEVDAERAKVSVLEYLPAGTVHRLFPEGADDIVCIGAGGGLDLMTAKYFGAKSIDGVEINKGVVYAVRDYFYEFAGNLYNPEFHPDVNVTVAEGRNFLERSEKQYDIVQLSGVDTFSTTEAGAFSLSENYLYTVEAFENYLEHLKPGGALTLTRWFYPKDVREPTAEAPGLLEPQYSLRLMAVAREALERRGIQNSQDHSFSLHSENFTVIVVRNEPFPAVKLDVLHEHCERMEYGVLWSPRESTPTVTLVNGTKTYENPIEPFALSDDPEGYIAKRLYDVSPTTDDKPFFFEVSKLDKILTRDFYENALGGFTAHGILMVILVEILLLGFLFILWPMRRLAREAFPGGKRVRMGTLLYFSSIGFGFIVVEIVLSQKFVLFLGHPIYALAVILFSMLLFSGIGSLISYRFPLPRFATLIAGGLALLPAYLFPMVFESCLGMSLMMRVAISVALLAPLGLVMGIPFPVGLRVLNKARPQLIPWAWAINGYTSVLGSVLAVVLAIELGFMVVLIVAAAVYGLGLFGYSLMATRAALVSEEN